MIDMTGIDELPSGRFRVRVQHEGETLSGTKDTQEEAILLRDALKREVIDRAMMPAKSATCLALAPKFLASREGHRTADGARRLWEKRIATAPWARLPIVSVTRRDGMMWLDKLRVTRTAYDPKKHGKRRTKRLAWQTRKHCLNLARRFFQWGVEQELITSNPFAGLRIEREDGDEDEGFQDCWYLDCDEQQRLLAIWDTLDGLTDQARAEKWLVAFAMGTALREQEQWCLHLADVHVDGDEPHVIVRYGSWSKKNERYLSPKGKRGERRIRRVPLFGIALEAAKKWLEILPTYAPENPLGLMFPTPRGCRRDQKPPRSWAKVIEKFGVVPRIGEKPWWHLLRHTCASSLVSGWWGMRWSLEDVQRILGHSDLRTTQRYAHLAPDVIQSTATRAQAAFSLAVTRPSRRSAAGARGVVKTALERIRANRKSDRSGGRRSIQLSYGRVRRFLASSLRSHKPRSDGLVIGDRELEVGPGRIMGHAVP